MTIIDPKNKIMFHLDRVAALKNDQLVYPVSMEMDLSDSCNLSCSWCRFSSGHKPGFMPLELAQQILQDLRSHGVESIVYSGGGEPTMNPDFASILQYGHALDFDQGVYTNGTLLEPHTKHLNDTTKFVYVSIDAAKKATYHAIKGYDGFNEVVQNVRRLCNEKSKTKVGIGFLVSQDNIDDIESFVNVLKFTGADYAQYRPAVGTLQLPQAVEAYERVRHTASRDPRIIVAEYKFRDLINDLRGGDRGYSTCFGHNLLGGISADGSVWFCLNHRYEEGFKIGDMKDQDFASIWKGEPRRKIARSLVVKNCPVLCRPHELNKFLSGVMQAENEHKNFL